MSGEHYIEQAEGTLKTAGKVGMHGGPAFVQIAQVRALLAIADELRTIRQLLELEREDYTQ